MNPDVPQLSREDLEVRLTALLLGELPAAEAGAMMQRVAQDRELAQLLARLEQTIGLVRAATTAPAGEPALFPTPLTFPGERREKLLQHLKLPTPAQLGIPLLEPRRRRVRWLVAAGSATVIVMLAVGLLLPTLSAAKKRGQRMSSLSVSQRSAEDSRPFRTWSESEAVVPSAARPSEVAGQPLAPAANVQSVDLFGKQPEGQVVAKLARTAGEITPGASQNNIYLPPSGTAAGDALNVHSLDVVGYANAPADGIERYNWGTSGANAPPASGAGVGGGAGQTQFGSGLFGENGSARRLVKGLAEDTRPQTTPDSSAPSVALRSDHSDTTSPVGSDKTYTKQGAVAKGDSGVTDAAGKEIALNLAPSGGAARSLTRGLEGEAKAPAPTPAAGPETAERFRTRYGIGPSPARQRAAEGLASSSDRGGGGGMGGGGGGVMGGGGAPVAATGSAVAPPAVPTAPSTGFGAVFANTAPAAQPARNPQKPAVTEARRLGITSDAPVAKPATPAAAPAATAGFRLLGPTETPDLAVEGTQPVDNFGRLQAGGTAGGRGELRQKIELGKTAGAYKVEPGGTVTFGVDPATGLPVPPTEALKDTLKNGTETAKKARELDAVSGAGESYSSLSTNAAHFGFFANRGPLNAGDVKTDWYFGQNGGVAQGARRLSEPAVESRERFQSLAEGKEARLLANTESSSRGAVYLPMPALKGAPEDLPSGRNIEPLGETVREQREAWGVAANSVNGSAPQPPPTTQPTDRAKGVPLLGDIPLAGRLFRPEGKPAPTAGAEKSPADTSRAYAEKRREVDELARFRDTFAMKIASEQTDTALPKTTTVEIVDRAVPATAKGETLWERIRGTVTGDRDNYRSAARVKVERDASDITPMVERQTSSGYDPYFVQTEYEVIQSQRVLDKVIDKLNLRETWAGKSGDGKKLSSLEAFFLLRDKLRLRPAKNTGLIEIGVKSDKPDEAARIANAIADEYRDYRLAQRTKLSEGGIQSLREQYAEQEKKVTQAQEELKRLEQQARPEQKEAEPPPPPKPPANAPIPQPEVQTAENPFSTFSLNVSDVSFKLAAASLEKGVMPEPASVRSEEFINAFDYRDPEAPPGVPVAFAWERARYPFAHNRDLLRFSVKTAAQGRQAGRPLNLVLLLDNSGSMERADRVSIIREALQVLAAQLQPQDKISVVAFARTARLWVDGLPGSQAGELVERVGNLTPQGGTNLEDAMNLAYQTALRHYLANGINRVVVLTDGAANLGDVDPDSLKQRVEAHRKQGIALDCFGIGWEGYNDDLLEVLSRNGDGRYGFVNTPDAVATEFASQLAGALQVAASDVKVQVEFNPARVKAYRQVGYAKHQLTKEQFRDNTVDAAEIAAAEAGNALYVVETNPEGQGPLATVRVRYKVPGTSDYRELEWPVPYAGVAVAPEQSSPAMRLATTAAAFSEWLVSSPFAGEVTPDKLLATLGGVPEVYGADARPKKLEWMIRQAKSISGK